MWRRNKKQVYRLKRDVEASKEGFEKNLEARRQLCNLIVGKSYNHSESTDESRCASEVSVREVVGCEAKVAVGGFTTVGGWVEDEVELDKGEFKCEEEDDGDDVHVGEGKTTGLKEVDVEAVVDSLIKI